MEEQIQEMVARGVLSIDRSIDKECGVQHWPHHVIEVADKRVPPAEMGVHKNCEGVVVLKVAAKGTGVNSHGNRDEKGIQD